MEIKSTTGMQKTVNEAQVSKKTLFTGEAGIESSNKRERSLKESRGITTIHIYGIELKKALKSEEPKPSTKNFCTKKKRKTEKKITLKAHA